MTDPIENARDSDENSWLKEVDIVDDLFSVLSMETSTQKVKATAHVSSTDPRVEANTCAVAHGRELGEAFEDMSEREVRKVDILRREPIKT